VSIHWFTEWHHLFTQNFDELYLTANNL